MFGRKKLRGIERLENKELLACDVAFTDGLLDIHCDGEDDLVNVFGDDDGTLSVNVGDGLIPVGSSEDLSELNIHSGPGADNVVLTGVSADSVSVNTGPGDDRVTMGILDVGDDLDIKTGPGNDRVSFIFGANVGGSVDIKTGAGDDTVEVLPFFGGLTVGDDVKIDGKSGNDTFIGESNIAVGGDLDIKRFETFEPGFPDFPF